MYDTRKLDDAVLFPCGLSMPNRFMLAPMTNSQSHSDGRLSDEEFHWLTMRAHGGFGITMTCAAHVQAIGQGFPGQLGIFSDIHLEGHRRLAEAINAEGVLSVIQLHHAGLRSPSHLIGQVPVSPSGDEHTGARALSHDDVCQLRDDFIMAASRAQKAGYHGVEIHGAHGYVLTQFLSEAYNRRTDAYGGSIENRSRIISEILQGVRDVCGQSFLMGLRLSPERHGLKLREVLEYCQIVIDTGLIDFLDVSLWDCFKMPEEAEEQHQTLLEHVMGLRRDTVKLTVAGQIKTGAQVREILDAGADFVTIGRAGILHHDYPRKVIDNPAFVPTALPVTPEYLRNEGLSEVFVNYMRRWAGFVAD